MAAVGPEAIDYVNMHGTATEQNDQMEAKAINTVFGDSVACSSTKAFTGHTLGAAGALEAAICALVILREDGKLPPQLEADLDPSLPSISLTKGSAGKPIQTVISNSFAFGGNNIALILQRGEACSP